MAGEKIVQQALKAVRELNPLGLFSKATEEAAKLPQAKGTGEQMRAMLVRQGVKPDELKFTGFDEWAKGKKNVTRDEVVEFLRRNQVQVGEERLFSKPVASHIQALDGGGFAIVDDQGRVISDVFPTAREARPAFQAMLGDAPTKFDQYTLPGGDNYREVLLTRPPVESDGPMRFKMTDGEMRRNDPDNYRSSHWDTPNVLAHLRMKDRVDPQGRRVLHLEELQSDWAQEGRKKGFMRTDEEAQALRAERDRLAATPREQRTPEISQRIIDINGQLGDQGSRLPSAPFVTSTEKWTDLALKRALREAAEGNYDAIAWTPGAEQAKRYDLSKQVSAIRANLNPDGSYQLGIRPIDGNGNMRRFNESIPADRLADYVGKEMAEKIAKTVTKPGVENGHVFDGLDLQVGGEGMIGYYDKIVPKRLQELVRPLDPEAKFGTVNVSRGNVGASGDDIMNVLPETRAMSEAQRSEWWSSLDPQRRDQLFADYRAGEMSLPSLNLTPAMREKIKEGLPLFTMMPAAVGLGATASQMQEGENPAAEGQGFDKGGAVKKAIAAARSALGYTDPPTKKIDDWKWRPLSDVDKELGLRKIPPHVQQFGDFMREMSDKAAGEGLSARDLIKGYTTTRASIQRQAVDADKLRALGLDLPSDVSRIRPEGAWAEWLMTPMGQRYLDAASKGTVEGDAVANAIKIMSPFGRHETDIPDAMRWAAENLPGREARASELVTRAAEGTSSPAEWRQFTSDIRGVGPSKSGFLASLYGRGDQPTLDARQIILNTGSPTKEAGKYIARGGGEGGVEAVERLAGRQRALELEAPSKYDPFYQHLAHHAIWDKASNEMTTHADVVNAMRNAAIVLGIPAAGAATMGEDQPAERASGGRLLIDQYPTHYLPDVGRQVMADGGEPTAQARRRAALDELGAFEDRPVMDPETMGQNWASAVQRFRDKPLRAGETVVRPFTPSVRDEIGQAIAGDDRFSHAGELRGRAADLLVGSRGTPGSGTVGFGVLDAPMITGIPLQVSDVADAASKGDYASAALGAALPAAFYARRPIMAAGRAAYDAGRRAVEVAGDVLGRVPAPVAAGAAGAAVMAPQDAEAAKLDAAVRAARRAVGKAETFRGSDLVAKDPRAAIVKLSERTPSGDIDFGQAINNAEYKFTRKGDLQPWKEFDPYQVYRERGLVAGLLGDRSAAGSIVHEINGTKLTEPVNRSGGGEFQRSTEGPEVWASRPSAVKNIYTRINKGMEDIGAPKDTPVFASHVVMGVPGIDSTQKMAKGILRQIEPTRGNIDLKAAETFDAAVRRKYPDWPGILNSVEAEAYLANNEVGKRTSTILQMLDTAGAQRGGLPNLGATRFAMMEPRLVSADQGSTGFAISRLDPNRITNAAAHDTYPTGMLGPSRSADDYAGGTRYQVPLSVMFPDWWKNVKPTYVDKRSGLIKATTPTNIQQSVLTQVPLQRASQEWLDNLMTYMEANPKKWGYRHGGGVSHHAMMIAKQFGSSPRETVNP